MQTITCQDRNAATSSVCRSEAAQALAIADQLDVVPDTGADPDLIVNAAASLRLMAFLLDMVEPSLQSA